MAEVHPTWTYCNLIAMVVFTHDDPDRSNCSRHLRSALLVLGESDQGFAEKENQCHGAAERRRSLFSPYLLATFLLKTILEFAIMLLGTGEWPDRFRCAGQDRPAA